MSTFLMCYRNLQAKIRLWYLPIVLFRTESVTALLKVLQVRNLVHADLDYGNIPIKRENIDQMVVERGMLELTHITPESAPRCQYIRVSIAGERHVLLRARWDTGKKSFFIVVRNEANKFVVTEHHYSVRELLRMVMDGNLMLVS